MNRRKKIIIGLLLLLSVVVIVGAAINMYFGRVYTEIDVEQPITIDGKPANEYITHKIKIKAGESEAFKHTIGNSGKIDANITQMTTGTTPGLTLTMTWLNGTAIDYPFVLKGSDKKTLVFTYDTDLNLIEKVYNVRTYFSCEEL